MLSQALFASGPSVGGASTSRPENPSSHAPTSFPGQSSRAHSLEELIQSLCDQLEEKYQKVENLEVELQELRSKVQSLKDQENLLIAELVTQVHDLDCKLFFPFPIVMFCFIKTLVS